MSSELSATVLSTCYSKFPAIFDKWGLLSICIYFDPSDVSTVFFCI